MLFYRALEETRLLYSMVTLHGQTPETFKFYSIEQKSLPQLRHTYLNVRMHLQWHHWLSLMWSLQHEAEIAMHAFSNIN